MAGAGAGAVGAPPLSAAEWLDRPGEAQPALLAGRAEIREEIREGGRREIVATIPIYIPGEVRTCEVAASGRPAEVLRRALGDAGTGRGTRVLLVGMDPGPRTGRIRIRAGTEDEGEALVLEAAE